MRIRQAKLRCSKRHLAVVTTVLVVDCARAPQAVRLMRAKHQPSISHFAEYTKIDFPLQARSNARVFHPWVGLFSGANGVLPAVSPTAGRNTK